MIPTRLAVTASLLDTMVSRDVYESNDFSGDLGDLLSSLDDSQLENLGPSYGDFVRFLAVDVPRLRSAADAAYSFDLREALAGLLDAYRLQPDVDLAETLVAFSASGLLENGAQASIEQIARRSSGTGQLNRYVSLFLEDDEPVTDLDRLLAAQIWPGTARRDTLRELSPIVYVAEEEAPPTALWATIVAAVASGARVRRLPRGFSRMVDRRWISSVYPLVFWSGSALAEWTRVAQQRPSAAIVGPREVPSAMTLARLLGDLARAVPGAALNFRAANSLVAPDVFSGESLNAGAFDLSEMCYLGAGRPGTIQRLAKLGLSPRSADVRRWTFDQLLTVRIIQALKANGSKVRMSPLELVANLHAKIQAADSTELAIDASGTFFERVDGQFVALDTGQQAMEQVLQLDRAFGSFKVGGGIYPDLLRPGRHVSVDPLTLLGSPNLDRRRIPVRAVGALAVSNGEQVVRSTYPELTGAEYADALRIHNGIIAASN